MPVDEAAFVGFEERKKSFARLFDPHLEPC